MRRTCSSGRFPPVFRILAAQALTACLTACLTGCLAGGGGGDASGPATAQMRLVLSPAALVRAGSGPAPALDSLLVRITGEDMAPVEFAFSGDSLTITLDGLPAGEGRLVNAYLFRSRRLLYAGSGTFAFRREQRTEAVLRCDPQFSRVKADFHLPAGMPVPVAAGLLKLSGTPGQYTAPLRVRDEFGAFLIDELPGGVRYDVNMELSDSLGKVRYQAARAGVYLPVGEEARWDLSLLPIEASAGLALSLGAPKEAVLNPAFPSRKRGPVRAGEVIVSEFYAAPGEKDSASQGEWWELFNRSADTLVLAGCRLARDRGAGATRSYAFDSAAVLPPGRALVFGRAAATASVHYADFTLVNTASSLLLLCAGDSLVVDSLRYSAASEDTTALPMREGHVTGLDAARMSRRGLPGSWCLTGNRGGKGVERPASPGGVAACGEGG